MNKGNFVLKGLIMVVLLALFMVNIGQLGRSIPDEKRYYQSTREMVSSGDYVTPRYHGALRFQKPILSYWAILLSYKAFGVNWFGARFPSAFAAMLTIMLMFSMANRFFGRRAAVFAAIILASTELYYMYARFAAPDMLLLFFITLSLFLFIEAYYRQAAGERRTAGLCAIGFYVAAALGFLTKGPFGVVFPVVIPLIFLASNKELGLLKRMHVLPGIAIFIAIAAPWFVKMTLLHGSEYWGNIWSLEIVKRFQHVPSAGGVGMIKGVIGAAAFYAGMLLLRFLPWTVFIPAAIALRTTPSGLPTSAGERTGRRFFLIWFVSVFTVLVLMGAKQSHYLLMLAPALGVFLGDYFAKFGGEGGPSSSPFFRAPYIAVIVLSAVMVAVWLVFLFYVWGSPILSVSLLLLLLPVSLVFAYIRRKRAPMLLPIAYFVFASAMFFYISGYCIPLLDDRPLERFAGVIERRAEEADIIGVGSNHISYHRLNTYLEGHHVSKVYAHNMSRKSEKYPAENSKKLQAFLSDREHRVFCAITSEEYAIYVPEAMRKRLYLLDEAVKWRKIHKLKMPLVKEILTLFFNGDRKAFLAALREDILLVSNRP